MSPQECDCSNREPLRLATVATTVVPVVASAWAFVDRLTPTFAGLWDFRARLVGAVGVLSAVMIGAIWYSLRTHLAPSLISNAEIRHYSYDRRTRLAARLLAAPAAVALAISVWDFRFWYGDREILQGTLLGVNAQPVQGVVVDALNLDRRPVTTSAVETDAAGRFVLELVPESGRVAFLSSALRGAECAAAERLSPPPWDRQRRVTDSDAVIIPTDCPPSTFFVVTRESQNLTPRRSETDEPLPQLTAQRSAGVVGVIPWQVQVILYPKTPFGIDPKLVVTADYPSDVDAIFPSERDSGGVLYAFGESLTVRPRTSDRPRPAFVVVRVSAFGFEPQSYNTGPLTYISDADGVLTAKAQLTPELKPSSLPSIENAVPLTRRASDSAAFEATLVNPRGDPVSVTRFIIRASRPQFGACFAEWITYDIKLWIRAGHLMGIASVPNDANAITYPVLGDYRSYCGSVNMHAEIAVNRPIAAGSRAVLRFNIEEGEKVRTRDGLVGYEATEKAPSEHILDSPTITWDLGIEINRQVVLSTTVQSPSNLFRRLR